MTIYRAAGPDEDLEIQGTGSFRPGGGSLEGKWFAVTLEHAREWGRWFQQWDGTHYTIWEAEVAEKVLRRMTYAPLLDGIGEAYYAAGELLPSIRPVRRVGLV